MHLPAHNVELRLPVLHQFIAEHPLGILTTAIKSPNYPLLQVSHIPWIIDSCEVSGTSQGRLRGHLARQNPQAKAIIEHAEETSNSIIEEDVLVVFNADIHHYVTPKFYVETKPATGKVVPTWNYETVQVYGRARVYTDSRSDETADFLNTQISDLAGHLETDIMGYGRGSKQDEQPWAVSDAPQRYIDLLRKNIIGIEIEITSISGRFKMSQEKNKTDRNGVVDGLRQIGSEQGVIVGGMVERRAKEYDEAKNKKEGLV